MSASPPPSPSSGQRLRLEVELPSIHLGRIVVVDGAASIAISGEPLPRHLHSIRGTITLGPGYDTLDISAEGEAVTRDPASAKCTCISPGAKRHLRHVTPGATAGQHLRRFTCDVLPQQQLPGPAAAPRAAAGATAAPLTSGTPAAAAAVDGVDADDVSSSRGGPGGPADAEGGEAGVAGASGEAGGAGTKEQQQPEQGEEPGVAAAVGSGSGQSADGEGGDRSSSSRVGATAEGQQEHQDPGSQARVRKLPVRPLNVLLGGGAVPACLHFQEEEEQQEGEDNYLQHNGKCGGLRGCRGFCNQ